MTDIEIMTQHFGKSMPLKTVLISLSAQEGNDGDEGDAMQAAADALTAKDAEIEALRAKVERLAEERKRAPVQGFAGGIPWKMHLRAYDAYCKKYGPQPALIKGGCRGGFGVRELDDLIPGWREELSRIKTLEAEIERLAGLCSDYEDVLADKRRLTRELDVALHGEEGAAKQASLCDLIEPAKKMRAANARMREALEWIDQYVGEGISDKEIRNCISAALQGDGS